MKTSRVLLKAAERIANGDNTLSCCAIWGAQDDGPNHPAAEFYPAYFRPPNSYSAFWASGPDGWADEFDPDGQHTRIVALCLAAAIAKAEGK